MNDAADHLDVAQHLRVCAAYKKSIEAEQGGEELQEETTPAAGKQGPSTSSGTTGVAAAVEDSGHFVGGAGTKRPATPAETPVMPPPPWATSTRYGDTTTNQAIPPPAVTPAPTAAPKKPRTDPAAEFIFNCLACGRSACPYENGYTVLKEDGGQQHEHDPSEPKNNNGASERFDSVKAPLRLVVGGIMRSNGIWTTHKFIGNCQLDLKLKTWMRNRLDPKLVESNWAALRRGVKETLRYKRQQSVRKIKGAHFGKL